MKTVKTAWIGGTDLFVDERTTTKLYFHMELKVDGGVILVSFPVYDEKVSQIFKFAGAWTASELKGKAIRVVQDGPVWTSHILGFGHQNDDEKFFRYEEGDFKLISLKEMMES